MPLSLSCKQGRLELTEDGHYLHISSLVAHEQWREPVTALRLVEIKPGRLGSCSALLHGAQTHLVTMLIRAKFDTFLQYIQHIQSMHDYAIVEVREVAALAHIVDPVQAAPSTPPPPPAPWGIAPPPPPHSLNMAQSMAAAVLPHVPMPQPAQPAAPVLETTVKAYKDARDYQRDVKWMQAKGWSVVSALDHHKDRSLAYKLLVPFGSSSSGTGQIVVTYQRPKK